MQNIDWKKLPFDYLKTNYNIRCYFKDGSWGKPEVTSSEYLNVHMAATGLHYGQEAFEGMKAFRGKDDKIRLFRWEENSKRLINSAKGIKMPEVPKGLFKEMIFEAVKLNKEYVPPYGSGAALYVRPLLYGSGPRVGVKPSLEYTFVVFVTPVGPYFKGGIKPIDVIICRNFDRAAPLGTGNIKIGGNYAAGLIPVEEAHKKGFANVLFLDAVEKKYIDESGPANFFGIKNNTYSTPDSPSILPSITNKSLIQLSEDMGLKTERRKIPVEELDTFDEAGACGTAAVISPIKSITDPSNNKVYNFCKDDKPGPVSMKLYEKLVAIQNGDEPDLYGWVEVVE